MVIGYLQRPQAAELLAALEQRSDAWKSEKTDALRLAVGCAFAAEHPGLSVEQLARLADMEM